ncbi:hypothetical protein ACKKBG_A11040 [Auxenochlorella protothecoides x Auxenochlorella symbiontica]
MSSTPNPRPTRPLEEMHAAYGWIQGELLQKSPPAGVEALRAPSVAKLVPQINSYQPGQGRQPLDPTSAGRHRLQLRLDLFGLSERPVVGDGACQFRALADQLYGSQDAHALVRESVVAQLRRQPGMYQEYVPQEYRGYCDDMAQPQAWGDHVTLQAAADCLGLRIALVTSFPDTAFLEIAPRGGLRSSRVLWLSFWAEVHYNSIYPKGEAPALFMGPSAMPMSQPGRSQAKFLGSRRLHHLLIG